MVVLHRLRPQIPPVRLRLVVACLALLFGVTAVWGGPSVAAQTVDSSDIRQFQRADALLRSGDQQQALELLETLYEGSPQYVPFYRKLKEAYEQAQQYEDALRLVNDQLGDSPTPELLSEKGRLLYQNGEQERALKTLDDAIAQRPDVPTTYRTVYRTLMDLRRYRRAIDVLLEARSTLNEPGLYRAELAHLYNLDGQHGKAMEEYIALLSAEPDRLRFVQERLRTFVLRNEGLAASIDVVRKAVNTAQERPAYRKLLAWLLVKADNYGQALQEQKALDQLREYKGHELFAFGQKAADADQFEVATQAFEWVLDRHPTAPIAAQTQRALAETYRRWAAAGTEDSVVPADTTGKQGRLYDAARSAYDTFLDRFPSHQDVPAVLAALGSLQLDVYRSLDAAEQTLTRVVERAPETSTAQEAQLDLGRIALLRGHFDRAGRLFSRLTTELPSGNLADQARFERASVQFYRGNFEDAQTQAKAVGAKTSSDVANDAIALTALIQQNQGPDSLHTPLHLYAQAQFRKRQRNYGAAHRNLDSLLTNFGRHSLADDARYGQATLYIIQGDTTAAMRVLTDLTANYPGSPFADRSLFRLGKIQEDRGRLKAAADTYDRLLRTYPESLRASDARARLRSLQGQQG